MRKKIISLILGVLMCCSMFAGCTLIEHNDEKDAQQVIAVINPITDTSNDITYTSTKRYIYKSDLNRAMNMYAQQYMQSYGMSLKETTEQLLDELITRELLLIEADRLETQKLIEFTQKDENDVMRSIYASIDSQLVSLRNEILGDFNETAPSASNSESTSTTYPTPDAETTDEDYTDYERDENGNIVYEPEEKEVQDKDASGKLLFDDNGDPVMIKVKVPRYKVWEPELSDYPGMRGTEEQKSLERESVQRFIALIKEVADADFKATKEDKAKFAEDYKKIDDIINTKGIEYVYPELGGLHVIEYIIGESARQSVLITKLRDYIVDGVEVTDEEVVDAYTKQLTDQVEKFTDNQSAYQSALSGGNTTMLYLRDDSYFYVKHILLPFSDEQTAALNAYKSDPQNADKDYKDMRDSLLVNGTVVYPHVNGENDLSNPKTVEEVYNEIYAAMERVKNNPKEAERLFDEFTYKYNTDNGAFGYGKSYAVKRNDEEGHSGYMEEFYRGAMELFNDYKVGEMLKKIVVTDYGVHLMYFSQTVTPGTIRSLNDYLTPGEYKTVRETFKDVIQNTKENNAFTSWQNERITYYREKPGIVKTYEKRYKSLYKD